MAETKYKILELRDLLINRGIVRKRYELCLMTKGKLTKYYLMRINFHNKPLILLVFLTFFSIGLSAQSDSILVSIPDSKSIELIDILHLYKDYSLESDSIWRLRDTLGRIAAEGAFVKKYQSLKGDSVLVKHGIHNYFSPSGSVIFREVYWRGQLLDTLSFD